MQKTWISILMLLWAFDTHAESVKVNPYPDLQGKIIKEIKYTDKSGENVIVLTQTDEIISRTDEYGTQWRSQDIYAYRFLFNQGKMEKMWQIHDFVHDCMSDGFGARFFLDLISISDLNKDNLKEVWISYQTECAGDPGPVPTKIIMYDGLQKYALRGESREIVSFDENGKPIYYGGEYQMDSALKNDPTFSKFAKVLWKKINDKFKYQQ